MAEEEGNSRTQSLKTSKKVNRWTAVEDTSLKKAVQRFGACGWKEIANVVGTRNDLQCFHRWQKVLRPGLTKGPWTVEEDKIILTMVKGGESKWAVIAKKIPGRLGKQIRERYFNHLDPSIKKGPWTEAEDGLLKTAQAELGNKWAKIAKLIPGRPENMIKNRWNVLNYPRKRNRPNRSRRTVALKKRKKSVKVPIEQATEEKTCSEDELSSLSSATSNSEEKIEQSVLVAAHLLLNLTRIKF